MGDGANTMSDCSLFKLYDDVKEQYISIVRKRGSETGKMKNPLYVNTIERRCVYHSTVGGKVHRSRRANPYYAEREITNLLLHRAPRHLMEYGTLIVGILEN
jgi:hypothetical protein